MKFTCLQENLSKGLSTVVRAVPIKSPLPILSNVLISAEKGRLKLSGTNAETSITTYIGASVEREGSVAIPAKLFRDFVANLHPSTLEAVLDEDLLRVSSEKTKSRFNGVSAAEFPDLPVFPKTGECLILDPKVFSDAVNSVVFSAAADSTRPVFSGVYLSYEDGVLTIAASDGFRLSEKVLKLFELAPERLKPSDPAPERLNAKSRTGPFTTIIPAKVLADIARIFSTSAEPIKFMLNSDENLALFSSEDTLVSSNIIGGEYPDYKRIIPKDSVLEAIFSSAELLDSVKLTNVFAKEAASPVKIKFEDGVMYLTSSSTESGEHQSQINAEVKGESMEVSFNLKYLMDFLTNVKCERLSLKTTGSTKPCLIRVDDEDSYLHIIMPMQAQ